MGSSRKVVKCDIGRCQFTVSSPSRNTIRDVLCHRLFGCHWKIRQKSGEIAQRSSNDSLFWHQWRIWVLHGASNVVWVRYGTQRSCNLVVTAFRILQTRNSKSVKTMIPEAPVLVEGGFSRWTGSPNRRDVHILITIYLWLRKASIRKITLQNIDISIELDE